MKGRDYLKFSTKNNKYLYDVGTHNVYQVDECIYRIIDDIGHLSKEKILKKYQSLYKSVDISLAIKSIIDTRKEGHLLPKPKNRRYKLNLNDKSFLDYQNKIGSLTLEVTQKCNLRCTYCINGEKYQNRRGYSENKMDFSIAKKAIDYYVSHSKDAEVWSIAFSGGEPLLNFSLIKKCMDYCKSEYKNLKVFYHMTTNGILLKDEILDCLVENPTFIAISLDGPEEIHDKHRIFPNKKGTFSIIMDNLSEFKKKYPFVFSRFIILETTLEPPFKLKDRYNFLMKNELIAGLKKQVNFTQSLELFYSDEILNSCNEDTKFSEKMLEYTKDYIINNRIETNKDSYGIDPFLRKISDFRNIYMMKKEERNIVNFPSCLPGKRLFVDTQGLFHICFRVAINNSETVIGSVEDGIDEQKCKNILENFLIFRQKHLDCSECEYQRFCKICFAHSLIYSKEEQNLFCKRFPTYWKKLLQTYFEIEEENPNAFKTLFETIKKGKF